MTEKRALVLGGGGVTGIAWELGMLHGLLEAGLDLTDADIVVGTSAGSVVGAQITSGRPLADWYAVQLEPPHAEIGARFGPREVRRLVLPAMIPGTQRQRRKRLGRAAMKHHPEAPTERLRVIGSRLAGIDWPECDLRIVAIDAISGRTKVFRRDSKVDLVHAVAASCAVPTVWPTVPIDAIPYMDGGMRSVANVDIARDADRVVVLAPSPRSFTRATSVPAQVEKLREAGALTAAVSPDEQARTAIGRNVLDHTRRGGAAEAGHRQAVNTVELIRAVWE